MDLYYSKKVQEMTMLSEPNETFFFEESRKMPPPPPIHDIP